MEGERIDAVKVGRRSVQDRHALWRAEGAKGGRRLDDRRNRDAIRVVATEEERLGRVLGGAKRVGKCDWHSDGVLQEKNLHVGWIGHEAAIRHLVCKGVVHLRFCVSTLAKESFDPNVWRRQATAWASDERAHRSAVAVGSFVNLAVCRHRCDDEGELIHVEVGAVELLARSLTQGGHDALVERCRRHFKLHLNVEIANGWRIRRGHLFGSNDNVPDCCNVE
mmetsp:Transcript_30352/g.98675  ORF Transcript_30352/g.98675 Transcript_30352/m.98675 type:complete len:222 (-) Transcript_30352:4890-5555(-)